MLSLVGTRRLNEHCGWRRSADPRPASANPISSDQENVHFVAISLKTIHGHTQVENRLYAAYTNGLLPHCGRGRYRCFHAAGTLEK
jgi:hypothetical protein